MKFGPNWVKNTQPQKKPKKPNFGRFPKFNSFCNGLFVSARFSVDPGGGCHPRQAVWNNAYAVHKKKTKLTGWSEKQCPGKPGMGKGGGGTLGAQGHRLVVVRFGLQPGAGASLSAPQPEAQPQPGEGPPQAVRRHQERDQQPVVQPEDGAGGRFGTPPPPSGRAARESLGVGPPNHTIVCRPPWEGRGDTSTLPKIRQSPFGTK